MLCSFILGVCICVYVQCNVCVCVQCNVMYVCIYVCVYICVCMCISVYVCMSAYMCVSVSVCVCVCVSVCGWWGVSNEKDRKRESEQEEVAMPSCALGRFGSQGGPCNWIPEQ